MILYMENPKESRKEKKKLELINTFKKVSKYKINIQKPIVFLSLKMNIMEMKLRKQSF